MPENGAFRVEKVLPVVHIEHGIALFPRVIVGLWQVDADAACIIEMCGWKDVNDKITAFPARDHLALTQASCDSQTKGK